MKKLIYILLLVVLLTGCQQSFESTFEKTEEISEEYDTSFFTEQLNGSIVPLEYISPLIGKIEEVKAEENASKRFIEARVNMLKSQLYWHLALGVGPAGFASDGFRCNDKKELDKVSEYLNKSYYHGIKATIQLDDILIEYPEYRPIVGISDTRTDFYFSPLGWIKDQMRINKGAFEFYCLNPQNLNITEE